MKTIDLIGKLRKYPLFTQNDVVKITGKSPLYTKIVLHRLFQNGYIKRIERGKYTTHEDPIIFSSLLYTPSYLSSWTGLRFHNMTTQIPNNFFVFLPVSKKAIRLDDRTEIIFIKTRQIWGYNKVRYNGFDIFVADREKTIIDCFLAKVSDSELAEALKSGDVDIKKLIVYAEKTKNKALIKRLGFLLELAGHDAYELLKHIDNNYVFLGNQGKTGLLKNSKWKVKYKAGIF